MLVLIAVVVVAVLASTGIFFAQNIGATKNSVGNPTATPMPSLTPTESPSPTETEAPVATPLQSVKIEAVSIENSTAASVTARSQTGQDIVITKIVLNGDSGNLLASDDAIHQKLPADGTPTKITINQHNADFNMGGTFTLTIVTANGVSFTSPSCSPLFY